MDKIIKWLLYIIEALADKTVNMLEEVWTTIIKYSIKCYATYLLFCLIVVPIVAIFYGIYSCLKALVHLMKPSYKSYLKNKEDFKGL